YGVLTNGATQLRDPYLDIRYRDENCKLEQSSEWLDGLTQLSRILDEVGETKTNDGFGVINAQLGNLFTALQKLSTQVSSENADSLVRAEAETLTKFLNQAAEELQTIWNGKEKELTDSVDEVNKLLTDIRDLNDQIRTQSIYGDKALELRDARNLALDELSKYMNINVEYSMERIDQFTEVEKLTVTIADSKGPDGKPIKLVDGIYAGQISIQDMEPVMNPDADAMKILDAMKKAVADAEKADPFEGQKWQDKVTALKTQYGGEAKAKAQQEIDGNKAYWDKMLDTLTKSEEKRLVAEAIKKNPIDPNDPDSQAKQDKAVADAKAAAPGAAEKLVKEEQQDIIDAAVKAAEAKAEREVKAEWQEAIQNAADNSPDVADAIKMFGKYMKADGTATNELYEKDANGVIQLDDRGKPKYADGLKLYPNDKYLIQVEPLKDERDRLMVDPYTASKKSEVVELGDNVLKGKIQAIRELLTEEGEYASSQDLGKTDEARLSDDPNAAIKRGIPYYQKALDTLAQQIARQFNEMNQMKPQDVYQSDKSVIDKDGNPVVGGDPDNLQTGESINYTFLSSADPKTTVQTADGKDVTTARMDALQKIMDEAKKEMDKYTVFPTDPDYMTQEEIAEAVKEQQDKWDAANAELLACKQAIQDNGLKDPLCEFYDGGVLFSNNGNNNDPNNITAANISIAIDWAEGPVRILNTKKPDFYDENGNVVPASSRNDNILHMISQYDAKLEYYAQDIQPDAEQPEAMFEGNFREVFTSISNKLGMDQYATTGKVETYTLLALDLENDRQSVSGVDLNEEATSMMQFSKSYSAACKLLTTLDSMLDKLINGTI
ncbi:MAG: hypothetical protein K2P15_00075, partial [Oscillospiraceae bacterium]|nr:hypothetical protein [Oscillospiraceae bacterium]